MMANIKEYYPSLLISEYKLGNYYMFIRNTNISEKEIDKSSGERFVEEKGGFALDTENASKKGGFALDIDNVETVGKTGGFALDKEDNNVSNIDSSEYNKKKKVYGHFSYEVGYVIGINEKESKIYVQFADTSENCCHIFKAGIPSDKFDMLDRDIQRYGK